MKKIFKRLLGSLITVALVMGMLPATVLAEGATEYELRVAGILVTDQNKSNILGGGEFRYDSSNNTLYINKDFTYSESYLRGWPLVENWINGLRIYVQNDVTLTAVNVFRFDASATIIGKGKLKVRQPELNALSAADEKYAYCIGVFKNSELPYTQLTFSNADVDVQGVCPIFSNSDSTSVKFKSANVYAKATGGTNQMAVSGFSTGDYSGIEFSDCDISWPLRGKFLYGSGIVNYDGSEAPEVRISQYDLKIGGTYVTSSNKGNILGDNVFSYNSNTKTLTVKGNYTSDNYSPVIESGIEGLNISVTADSTLKGAGGIIVRGYTTISGSGKLTLSASKNEKGRYNPGIRIMYGARLNIKDADIYSEGSVGIGVYPGDESLKIISSKAVFKALSSDYAMVVATGKCYFDDSYIKTPANGYIDTNGNSVYDNGAPASEVEIAVKGSKLMTGDYVRMGKYKGEDILWRCVDTDANGALMLTDDIITFKAFDASTSDNSISGSHSRDEASERAVSGSSYWADSNLRSWLNSSAGKVDWLCGNKPDEDHIYFGFTPYETEAGFLTNFSAAELNSIKQVTQKSILSAEDAALHTSGSALHSMTAAQSTNPAEVLLCAVGNYDEAYAEDVTDKMFLLDVKQLYRVYLNGGILGLDYYIGKPSEASAESSGILKPKPKADQPYNCWLRTPLSNHGSTVCCVYSDGSVVGEDGDDGLAYRDDYGVRPAFYIDEEKAALGGGRGTKEAPFVINGGPVPTSSPEPTPTPKPTSKPITTPAPTPVPTLTPTSSPSPVPTASPSPTPTASPVPVTAVRLDKKGLTIRRNSTVKINATVEPSNARYYDFGWRSYNPAIATVDDKGNVKGIKVGKTTIVGYAINERGDYVYGKCSVTVLLNEDAVNPEDWYVTIPNADEIYEGTTRRPTVTVSPRNAYYDNFRIMSGNTDIAEVDANGTVTFKKPGTVKLTYCIEMYGKDSLAVARPCKGEVVRVKSRDDYRNSYGYSFTNNHASFGYGSEHYIAQSMYEKAGLSKASAYWKSQYSEWDGSCVGMSSTSMFFYLGYLDAILYDPNASLPHDLKAPNTMSDRDIKLRKLIELFQIGQFKWYDETYLPGFSGSTELRDDRVEYLAHYIDDGDPVMISLRTSKYWGCGAGHAVLIYDYDYDYDEKRYTFYIYDPSGFVTEMRCTKRSDSAKYWFKFTYSDTTYTWYPQTYYTLSSLKEGYKEIRKRNKSIVSKLQSDDEGENQLLMICPDGEYTITNAAGQSYVITDEVIEEGIEGVEIFRGEVNAENAKIELYLPYDEYYISHTNGKDVNIAIANETNGIDVMLGAEQTLHITPELYDVTVDGGGMYNYSIEFTEFDGKFDRMKLEGISNGTDPVKAEFIDNAVVITGISTTHAEVGVSDGYATCDVPVNSSGYAGVLISDDDKVMFVTDEFSEEMPLPTRLQADAPECDLPSGTYDFAQTLSFNNADDDVVIRYTTDGSEPDKTSEVYVFPITISKSMTVKAKATRFGYDDSEVITLDYTLPEVNVPEISVSGGLYSESVDVVLTCEEGCRILYTLDDSDPEVYGNECFSKLHITDDSILRAVAVDENGAVSEELNESYVIDRIYPFDVISSVPLNDEGEVSEKSADDRQLSVTLQSYAEEVISAEILVVCYNENDKLVGVKKCKTNVENGINHLIFDIPQSENTASVILFMWDEDMKPLASAYKAL